MVYSIWMQKSGADKLKNVLFVLLNEIAIEHFQDK